MVTVLIELVIISLIDVHNDSSVFYHVQDDQQVLLGSRKAVELQDEKEVVYSVLNFHLSNPARVAAIALKGKGNFIIVLLPICYDTVENIDLLVTLRG